MRALEIPSIFRAVDKFSGPVNKMTKSAEASMSRFERSLRSVSQSAFQTSRSTALMAVGIIAPMAVFANEAVKFETQMSNVATLIDTNKESIKGIGDEVLKMSKTLPVPIEELTTSLYDIRSAGISAEKQFTTLDASARLATAGLSTTSEATNIMTSATNAFASENKSAAEISDILFKTVKYGKTTISDMAMAFGSTAPIIQSANVTLADFSAATAALTTLGTPASQAQNQLRASIISLQKPTAEMEKVFKKLGVTNEKELIQKNGNLVGGFKAVNKAIEEMGINTAQAWGSTEALAAVTSLTGATNKAYLTTLEDMTQGQNALNEAYEKQLGTGKSQMQLAKNNIEALAITLGTTLIPLITQLVQSVSPIIERFSAWASENQSTVSTIMKVAAGVAVLMISVSAISAVIGTFAKVLSLARYGVMAYNVVLGVMSGLSNTASIAVGRSSVALKAYAVTQKIVTVATKAWAVASKLMMGPIGWITLGVTGLAAGVYALSKAWSSETTQQKLNNEVRERALENSIEQRVEATLLFKALKRAEEGSTAYNETLKKLEQLQPGIIDKYNLQAKSLQNINAAEKELIGNIMKRAEEEARAELMKEKIKEGLTLKQEGPSTMASIWGMTGFGQVESLLTGEDTQSRHANKIQKLMNEADMLAEQQAQIDSGVINPSGTQTIAKELTKEEVTVTFNNLPEGTTISRSKSSASGFNIPKLGTTRG